MAAKFVFLIKIFLAIVVMFIADILAGIIFIVTFFQGRNITRKYIFSPFSKLVLIIFSISYKYHNGNSFGFGQKIYISNHTSTIDIFIICALALPNTRFFMSKVTYKFIPMTIAGLIMGIFYIDTQDKPKKRMACFKKAEKTLQRTGESVYLSPEGMRVTNGKMGKFNRGSFHMATNLKIPICPLYINIPSNIDPGVGFNALPGHIDIYELPQINTHNWVIEDIEKNKKTVRNMFIDFHKLIKS